MGKLRKNVEKGKDFGGERRNVIPEPEIDTLTRQGVGL
jgi:hypothetical protein